MKKVPYARDRLVEGYLWALAFSSQPEYNKARMFVGKLMALAAILDDTYDAYGTIQELELFKEAIQRLMCFTSYSLYYMFNRKMTLKIAWLTISFFFWLFFPLQMGY